MCKSVAGWEASFKLMVGNPAASIECFTARAVMVGFFSSTLFLLYSRGCIILCSPLQAVEAKQMQDEMAGLSGKPLKVKGGKAKVKKAQLSEIMPSPHGVRVVPRITAEMKAEAEKRTKKKIKVKKTIPNALSFFTPSSI